MTDELSIQPQKPSVMPYALGGAAIGTGAYFSPVGVTKQRYSSYEDILKESEDTFKKEIEKGGDNKGVWEAAKTHAEAVKKAGEEYDAKVAEIKNSATSVVSELPADNKAATALKDAENALKQEKESIAKSSEYKQWIKNAEKEFNNTKNKKGKFTFPKPDDIKNLGDKVSLNEVKEYEKLYDAYQTALKNSTNNVDKSALNTFKSEMGAALDGMYNLSVAPKKRFSIVPKKIAMDRRVQLLKDNIAQIIPEISDPKRIAHEMKLAGVDYQPGSKNYKKFVNKLNQDIVTQRAGLLNEVLGEKVQIDIIDPKTKKVVGKRTSYKNVEAFEKQFEANINSVNKFQKRPELKAFGGIQGLDTVENYDKALKTLEKKKGKLTIDAYNAQKNRLETGKKLANDYANITKAMEARYEAFFNKISHTQTLNEKIKNAISNEPNVQKTLQKLKNYSEGNTAINTIAFEAVEGTTLSAEEIAKKAVEKVESDAKYLNKIKTKAEALEAAKKAAEEEAKRLGVAAKELSAEDLAKLLKDKGLAATKDEAIANAKNAAKEAIEKDLGKIKSPNRWVNAAIGATLLAAAGWGIASSKKNA